jgi:hypothetical protein
MFELLIVDCKASSWFVPGDTGKGQESQGVRNPSSSLRDSQGLEFENTCVMLLLCYFKLY